MLLFNIEQKAFNARTYKQAFAKQKLYERTPSILAVTLKNAISQQSGTSPLNALTQADWEQTIAVLIPPEELKSLTDAALDSIFDYMNGKTDSASISLLPFKQHMVGAAGVTATKQILSVQPDCTEEQLMQMGLNLITGGDMHLCNPPAELFDLFNPMIESQLQFMTISIPDQITIIEGDRSGTSDDPRIQLNRIRVIAKLTPLIPLFFLLGLTVLAVRSLQDWLNWWSVPFIITGAISALFALLGSPILVLLIQRGIQNGENASVPPSLLSLIHEILGAVSRQILAPVVVEGALLTMAGIAMIVVAVYLSRREKAHVTTK
jgi:hypothetical protein